jgi:mannobiose 2-epimerase
VIVGRDPLDDRSHARGLLGFLADSSAFLDFWEVINVSRTCLSKTIAAIAPALVIVGSFPKGGHAQPLTQRETPALRLKIDALLREELTRHWYPQAVDRQRGGFHQAFARDWSPLPDENIFLVYQSRMTWTAAAFARYSPAHRDEFTGYARHGVAFLDRVMRDQEFGGFHWMLDPLGRLDPKLGDEKHVYGIAFVIYAASTVRDVTGDDLALQVARDAFDWLEQHAHDAEHGGYFEALRRDGTPILAWDENAPIDRRADRVGIYYGFKTMNVHIHLLEAMTALSRVDRRPVVRERLRELLGLVRDRIAVEPGALNLYLTRDWRAIPAHDSFGHDIETAYLLVEAAEALGTPEDPKTWAMARRLVDHALDWGWDDELGGFYDKGESFGGPAWDRKKVWWTEAEGLNALLVMHHQFGDRTDRYAQAFRKQWEFIDKHLIDPVHGGWFAETTRDGTLIGDGAKANPWKANYHTARAQMNVATLLRRLGGARPGP